MTHSKNPYEPPGKPFAEVADDRPIARRRSIEYLLSAFLGSIFVAIFGYSAVINYAGSTELIGLVNLLVATLLAVGFGVLVVFKVLQFVAVIAR